MIRTAAILGARLLLHNRIRLLLISVSVSVGVVIMFVELGLVFGIMDSQANIALRIRGDLVIMNRSRIDLHRWDNMYPVRLNQLDGVPGIASVAPIYEDHVGLKNPQDLRVRRIVLFAVQPDNIPLNIGAAGEISRRLRISHGFLFDRLSRPIFGRLKPGDEIELDRVPQLLTGYVDLGPDIVNDGAVVISEGDWLARFPDAKPIMGVIVTVPGADLEQVRKAILMRLPKDVVVLTPHEMRERENLATLRGAPVGVLFVIGALAGLVIGAINCYQVLFTEVSDRLPQYATLKAIGFSDRFIRLTVLAQAALLAATGFIVGLAVAYFMDAYVAAATMLPIRITATSALVVAVCAFLMCSVAGLAAARKAADSDPAMLY